MIVMKFGGAVLKDKTGFSRMSEIISSYSSDNLVVVISALGKTTKNLFDAARFAQNGKLADALTLLDTIFSFHFSIVKELITESELLNDTNQKLNSHFEKLSEILNGIALTEELSPRIIDLVISYGETLASLVALNFLNSSIKVLFLDSKEIITTDSNFGAAKPIEDLIAAKFENYVNPLTQENRIILTQGFVARNEKGNTTTMGIESSNLTASLFASYLSAKRLIIWADVEGIRTADPKITADAGLIKQMNHSTALAASNNGLKLIYPLMIDYASRFGFEIDFRSAEFPFGGSTLVSAIKESAKQPIITNQDNLTLFVFDSLTAESFSEFSENSIEFIKRPDNVQFLVPEFKISAFSKTTNSRTSSGLSLITILNISDLENIKESIEWLVSKDILSISYSNDNYSLRILTSMKNSADLIRKLHKIIFPK